MTARKALDNEALNRLVRPSREEFLAHEPSAHVPVVLELHEDILTPIAVFARVVGDRPGFLLESVEGGANVGRYSFVGIVDNEDLLRVSGEDPLTKVRERLDDRNLVRDPSLPRFLGGAVGYIGYDCIKYFEPKLKEAIENQADNGFGVPESAFMICDRLVVFDHLRRRLLVIVNAGRNEGEQAWDRSVEEISGIVTALRSPSEKSENLPLLAPPSSDFSDVLQGVKSNVTKEEYEERVARAKEYIAAGDIFQVVPSQRFERDLSADPFTVYRALRATNPSPYMFFLNFSDFTLAGSSPEIMVRLEEGEITLRPIAGTRPRGKTEEEDDRLAEELLADAKERAEHLMLVDLGRNDVGRVAEPGSVRVDEMMKIERYSHVMHIVSNVRGRIRKGCSAFDLIPASFPAGTVSGAPKIRAMEIIAELEDSRRGPYAGATGYIGYDGNSDTAIVLRTILMKDGKAWVQAGGGVVYDSVPAAEYQETVNKASAMLRALAWAEESIS